MAARKKDLGVRDIALKLRNDGIGVGDNSVGVRDIVTDVGHDSVGVRDFVANSVSGSPDVCIAGSTHAVNCPIASNTDWLSSSTRLPCSPRSSALHTSAHANPSST